MIITPIIMLIASRPTIALFIFIVNVISSVLSILFWILGSLHLFNPWGTPQLQQELNLKLVEYTWNFKVQFLL